MTSAVPTPAAGVISTFYSYKGGTGRSMALANMGCLLGKSLAGTGRVLLIDWDLEAPGLFRYFPICDLPENAERAGIIDYFTEVRHQIERKPELYAEISDPQGWEALQRAVPLDQYMVPNAALGVDLVKAGRGGSDYADRVASFDWAEFYRQYHLVYSAFRTLLAQRYAWTLIDSRTGLTDVSGVCTMLLPEKLVAVFTPNRQSVEGLIDLIHKAVRYRRESEDTRPLPVFPLPSRIVTEEHKLLQAAQVQYRSDFEVCFRQVYGLDLPENFLDPYFDEVAIPHKGFYGFGEQVAVRDDEKAMDALSINRAYERFFRRFTMLERAWDILPAATEAGTDIVQGEFKFDIFISYAHIDDEPVAGGTGWVTRFVRDLEVVVAQIAGKRPSIFFDQLRTTASDALREEVHSALTHSAVLVPILSPAYYTSAYAGRELEEFEHRAGTLNPEVSRIVPVDLRPIPGPLLLPRLLHVLAFDSGSEGAEVYAADSQEYGAVLHRVARTIATMLRKLREPAPNAGPLGGEPGIIVYLAETTSDLRAIRDRLRTELAHNGYTVIPQEPPPTDAKQLEQTLRYDLPRARTSLHLFSSKYGLIPEGETRAIGHIQYAIAAEFPIQRLIWAEANTEGTDLRQQEFIEDLNRNIDARTEIVRGSFESYRQLVFDRLRALSAPQETGKGRAVVYIVCRPEDLSAVAGLRDSLLAQNIEPILPATEGSPAELREDHQQNLQFADAVMVYWGASSETWLRSQQRDLLKERSRSTHPLRALIALAPPETDIKAAYRTIEFPTVTLGADPSKLVDAIRQLLTGSLR